jgi:hypothetical protein
MINVLIVVIIALVAALGVQTWRVNESHKFAELLQVEKQSMNELHAMTTRQEIAKQSQIETVWKESYAEQVTRLTAEATAANARAIRLSSVADRLRNHIYSLATPSGSDPSQDPTASQGSQTASGSGLVLANLYTGADREAIELAQAFDAAYSAGSACERLHDTVSTGH